MSSIVSRRPPVSVSTSQSKDFFWMSIRLGTSSTLSRRAKLRRVRGVSREAKTATPLAGDLRGTCVAAAAASGELSLRGTQARPAKIAQGGAYPSEGHSALTDPVRPGSRMWRGGRLWTATTIGRVQGIVATESTEFVRLPQPGDGGGGFT